MRGSTTDEADCRQQNNNIERDSKKYFYFYAEASCLFIQFVIIPKFHLLPNLRQLSTSFNTD